MSKTEKHLNSSSAESTHPIETVYTTVEAQTDQTDWLTVVSNLRQGNRQLLEQIAKLEQALATSQQALQTHKEEKQSQEITILQLQDEVKVAEERIGALFQQLETSHQIGQRQQTLIETLSQQLEITQAIVPHLEAENNDLRQENQKLVDKLSKTEQVALEMHRRFKQLQVAAQTRVEILSTTPIEESNPDREMTSTNVALNQPSGTESPVEMKAVLTEEKIATSDPTGESSSQPPFTLTDSPSHSNLANQSNPLSVSTDVTDKESMVEMNEVDPVDKNAPHWPAPKLDRQRPVNKGGVKLDLPKFPKK
jgi:chromosome segregation ATPase